MQANPGELRICKGTEAQEATKFHDLPKSLEIATLEVRNETAKKDSGQVVRV